MRRLLVVLIALALAPTAAQAKPHNGVAPDPSFGDGHGYATLQISGQDTIAYAATAVSGGTVVAGQATPSSGSGAGQVLVAKYDRSGKLDPAFGTHGVYRSAFPDADGPCTNTNRFWFWLSVLRSRASITWRLTPSDIGSPLTAASAM